MVQGLHYSITAADWLGLSLPNTTTPVRTSYLLPALCVLCGSAYAAESSIVGIMRDTLQGGGKFNVLLQSLVPSPLVSSTVESVSSTSLVLSAGVSLSSVEPGQSYVELVSGGVVYLSDVVAVGADFVTTADLLPAAPGMLL